MPTVVADVMIGDTLRGVVTDRDLVVRGMSGDVLPSAMAVAACLSEPPYCAEVDSTLEEAMEEMAQRSVGRLPVIGDDGRVIGVVTLSSLALRSPSRRAALVATANEVSRRSARAT